MPTPTSEQIREEATKEYQTDKLRQQGHDFTGNLPEDYELRESGYWERARDELMRMQGGIEFRSERVLRDMMHLYDRTFARPASKEQKQVRRLIKTRARETIRDHRKELRGVHALRILVVMSKGKHPFYRVYH